MSYYFGNIRPGYDPNEDIDDDENASFDEAELKRVLKRTNELKRRKKQQKREGQGDGEEEEENNSDESDDTDNEFRSLSFGSLKKAESLIRHDEAERRKRKAVFRSKDSNDDDDDDDDNDNDDSDNMSEPVTDAKPRNTTPDFSAPTSSSSEDSDTGFFEEDEDEDEDQGEGDRSKKLNRKRKHKHKHKHAPTEHSSKKRVSTLREIDGLKPSNKLGNSTLYRDIRFDRSTGRAEDITVIRRRYKFLDEYREREISELEKMLKDRKFVSKLDDDELNEMQKRLTSMKSRLQTVKNRDLESKIVKEYEDKINAGNKTRYHLKKSERRKVVQKWKFDHMGAKQRERVMDRKRKRRLGREFKQFEFHKQKRPRNSN